MQKPLAAAAAAALALGIALPAHAADEPPQIERQQWSFYGVFGAFDRAAEQRGFEVYKDVCANCHSLNLLAYRDLAEIGLSANEVTAVAASVQVEDGPNDQGADVRAAGQAARPLQGPLRQRCRPRGSPTTGRCRPTSRSS